MDYAVYALSRSGHHAFCYWLIQNMGTQCSYYNNAALHWEDKRLASRDKAEEYNKEKGGGCEIASVESFFVGYFSEFNLLDWGAKTNVLFLRSFENWAASSYKIGGMGRKCLLEGFTDARGNYHASTADLWREQAKYFLKPDPRVSCVYYDKWFSDQSYRKKLSKKFGLTSADSNTRMSKHGNGSSFTKMNKGKVDIRVLERKKMVSDEAFKTILTEYSDCVELTKKIEEVIDYHR